MKSFVSLLFIVLLFFFDYNMDMLKSREDFSIAGKLKGLSLSGNTIPGWGISDCFRNWWLYAV